jgi:hypothetical protein
VPSFGDSDAYETSLRYASEAVAHLFAHDESDRIIGDEWVYFGPPEAAGGALEATRMMLRGGRMSPPADRYSVAHRANTPRSSLGARASLPSLVLYHCIFRRPSRGDR